MVAEGFICSQSGTRLFHFTWKLLSDVSGIPRWPAARRHSFHACHPSNCVLDHLAGASETKLLFNVRLVGFHRLYAQMQFLRDLPRPMPLPDKPEHFQFSIGET